MAKAETPLVASIVDALAPLVALVFRVNCGHIKIGSRMIHGAPPGTPDVIGALRDGRFFGIEVKTKTGKARVSQLKWRSNAGRCGLLHGEARSVRDAVKLLNEWQRNAA